ncbi:MAG: T9SS type A sorting domain-containing protein [Candidatus Marinimicrobia bacterium]|nr:T9SS type A sorting domain-containing protein [Candidatus Neomarinimicrobiota bacterium]
MRKHQIKTRQFHFSPSRGLRMRYGIMTAITLSILLLSPLAAQPDTTTVFVDVSDTHLPLQYHLSSSVAAGDVNGDGHLDLVVGNTAFGPGWSGRNRLYLNDGTGHFTDVTDSHLPPQGDETLGLVLGDVDGDGYLDLFVANQPYGTYGGGQNFLYLNDGTGRFMDATWRLPQVEESNHSGTLADVNGDGSLDLLITGRPNNQPSRLLLNDGSGYFTEVTASHLPAGADTLNTYFLLAADLDGDWDLDILVINAWNPWIWNRQHEEIWLNDGEGRFTRRTDLLDSRPDDAGQSGDLFDLNRDGYPDIIVGQVFRNELYLSQGPLQYWNVTETHLPQDYRNTTIAFGDVNHDGEGDLILGNGTHADQIFINLGGGRFADSSAAYLPELDYSSTRGLALFDADGDGRLDIFCAVTGDGRNRLLLNTGNAQDTIPPLLRHDPAGANRVDEAGRGHLRVLASDESRWIRRALLLRSTGGITDTIPASPVGGELFQAIVDSLTASESWSYHWEAEDWAGNRSRVPEEDSLFTWTPVVVGVATEEPALTSLPEEFGLREVFPNPFNPVTTIRYAVPTTSQISLKIYDLRGRKMAILFNGYREAGNYEMIFDASSYASGVYFCHLTAPGISQVVKLSVVK